MSKQNYIKVIKAILDYSNLNRKDFSLKVGIDNPQWIADILNPNKKVGISKEKVKKIIAAFPEINEAWLLTGDGEMLKSEVETLSDEELQSVKADLDSNKAVLIPLVHIDSVGGVFSPNALAASEQYIERMIPFPDAQPGDVAILQSGNSMSPTIPAGAILQLRQVQGWREYFGYGNDFVLWLSDDRRITKQVLKYDADPANYVTCHSYNPEAADEELPKSMIREVWKVVNVLINKGW